MAITDGLIAYWKFDETGTNSRQDASGNGRHFSTVGASVTDRAAIVPAFARSLDLPGDATNGILSQADAAWMTLNHDFYISGWVLLDTNGPTTLLHHYDGIRGVIAGDLENSTKLWWMYVRGPGFQNGFKRADTPSIATGTPYFVEFWHDAAVEIGLQINRGTAYTLSWAHGIGDAAIIMRFGSGDGVNPLNGAANGWGIWDRIPSSGERDTLYNSGNGYDPFVIPDADLEAVLVTATAEAPTASFGGDRALVAQLATASAEAPAATFAADQRIAAVLTTASAEAPPAVLIGEGEVLMSQLVTASAEAPAAGLEKDSEIGAQPATAGAQAPKASLQTDGHAPSIGTPQDLIVRVMTP